MDIFLVLLGLASLGTSVILILIFIVNIFRKKPKKKFLLSSITCFTAFLILIIAGDKLSQSSTAREDWAEYESKVAVESESAENYKQAQEADYKKSCKTVSYEDIARNPNEYDGSQIKVTGKVTQVSEGVLSSANTYLVSVTRNEYDFWEDNVYVTYTPAENESRILEDDIVTFYGEYSGVTTYVSVLGSKVTVPALSAKYVEIQQ